METAIRLHHTPSGVVSRAEESRLLAENRTHALRRLRERIALTIRVPFDTESPALPLEFVAQRGPRGTISINSHNPAYPIIVATALDALESAAGSYAVAAQALGLTTSQLLRLLKSDREIWRTIETRRSQAPSSSDSTVLAPNDPPQA